MASPFRQMDDRREDTRIGVSWAVGVKSYVSGAAGGPDAHWVGGLWILEVLSVN